MVRGGRGKDGTKGTTGARSRRDGIGACAVALLAALSIVAGTAAAAGAASGGNPRPERVVLEPETISIIPGRTSPLRATLFYSNGVTEDVTARLLYASSRIENVTVSKSGVVKALASGSSDVTAKDPLTGLEARPKVKVKVAELRSLTLTPVAKVVRPGSRLSLKAWGTYENGEGNVDLTEQVVWSSRKPEIALVGNTAAAKGSAAPSGDDSEPGSSEPKGVVLGVSQGRAVIEAEDPESGVASSPSDGEVQVLENLLALAVSPGTKVMRINESTRFKVIGDFGGGVTADVTNDAVISIADPSIASIDASGRVKALRTGTTRVVARDRVTGLTSTDNAKDGVLQVVGALVSLTVTPKSTVVATGDRVALRAGAAYDTAGGSYNVSSKVTWTSSAPTTVTVDKAGRATCLTEGTATVSATDPVSGVTSTGTGGDASIRCAGAPVRIRVSPATNVLQVGKSRQMKAYVGFEDGSEAEVTKNVLWSSSDDKVVSIEATGAKIGNATALKPGTATITATTADGELSSLDTAQSSLLRVPGAPLSVLIFPRPTTVGGALSGRTNSTFQLKARVQYDGGATQGINAEVLWTSSNPNVLSVSNGENGPAGFARLKARGSVTVTIKFPKDGSVPALTDSIRFTVN